ncbi:HD-GYP domain-containing protein [uncultured Bradyrhizobium sp.]|uniref:HD-GYP domain-containing protein n=1 Tax=unclassified Sphingomonas TaxID=196159 RepID=UPI00260F64D8|nr:HD-GYP domain-containing protein [uncultured Bradyrhizobium sp.]
MKIKVPTSAVEIGMFVDSMEGSWWLNPFWKSSFLIASQKDLKRLTSSNIAWVVIDDSRGVGFKKAPRTVAAIPPEPRRARMPTVHVPPPPTPTPSARRPDFETQRVAAIIDRSKREVIRLFTDARMGKALERRAMTAVVDDICDSVGDDPTAVLKVTRLKKKNEYTYLHCVAVSALMIALGRHLKLGEDTVRELGLAGLLHDIGKMTIPTDLLEKPGRLTAAEFEIVRAHPENGYAMLMEDNMSSIVHDVILHHHEKLDGSGYPHRLSGDSITLHARIGAICDVYDAVTSKRSYKRQWTPSEALTQMRSWTGHFDPEILDAFMRCISIYPIGLLVRLRSNRLAVILTENVTRPTEAMARAFYLPRELQFIEPADVRLSSGLKGDAVVEIEDPERWFPGEWEGVRDAVLSGQQPTFATLGDLSAATVAS